MNLETLAVNIRPRNPWEAMDSGLLLARQWYLTLWRLWLLMALPSLLVLSAPAFLLPGSVTRWALFLFWLAKPFFEPLILLWIARALFGEQLPTRRTVSAVRKKMTFSRSLRILLHRFNPFNAYALPVLLLEDLDGPPAKKRLALLREGTDVTLLLTAAGFLVEIVLALAFMGVIFWLIPEELRWVDFGEFVFTPDGWLLLLAYLLSCSLVVPFTTSARFMIYISRRVELEAWDIEIGFKRIRQRLKRGPKGAWRRLAIISVVSLGVTLAQSAVVHSAQQDPAASRETIAEVLAQNEFGRKETRHYWVPKTRDDADAEPDGLWAGFIKQLLDGLEGFAKALGPFLAKFGEILLWCGVGLVVAFLLFKHTRWRRWLDRRILSPGNGYTAPEVLFGMDIRPESLPDDLGEACRRLLAQGRHRQAMGLLYRGTLSRLVNGHGLEIDAGHTENECCQKVQAGLPSAEAAFFKGLTTLWINIAYGHQPPEPLACDQLLLRWQELYGAQA